MGNYKRSRDTRVTSRTGEVRWVDYGEIRNMDPDDARWLGEQLLLAAVEAEAKENVE